MLDSRAEYLKTGAFQLGTVKSVQIGSRAITIQMENTPANPLKIVALAFHKGRSLLRKEYLLKSVPQPPDVQKILLICFQGFLRYLNEQITEGLISFPPAEPEAELSGAKREEPIATASNEMCLPHPEERLGEARPAGSDADAAMSIERKAELPPEGNIGMEVASPQPDSPAEETGRNMLPGKDGILSRQPDKAFPDHGSGHDMAGSPANESLKPEAAPRNDALRGDPFPADILKRLHQKPNVKGIAFVPFQESSLQSIISQGECPSEQALAAYCRQFMPILQDPKPCALFGKNKFFLLEADGHVCLIWPQEKRGLLFLYLTKYDQTLKQFLESECQTPSESGWREGATQCRS